MVRPGDIPECVPEMDEIKPEQEKAIHELLSSVKAGHGGQYPSLFVREEDEAARRDLAYKFLKARRWKLKDALAMVNSTVQFREENGLNTWRLFPSAFPLIGFDEADILATMGKLPGATVPLDARAVPTEWDVCYRALQSSYVNVYHYWDKEGHPVLYDCCGKANVTGILSRLEKATPVGKSLRDIIVPYHTYMNEVQYFLIRYASAKAKAGTPLGASPAMTPGAAAAPKKIMGITVVLDAEGMHMGMLQKRFINVVRDIFAVDQKYYPEVLHRLFVINTPGLLQTAYSCVKSSLDENTRRKVVFCSKSESLDVLRRVIDEDKIPQELGGACRCAGGCLPRYKDPDEDAAAGEPASEERNAVEVPTESITIKAGKRHTRDISLRAGDEIAWHFALEKADVHFSASFEATLDEAERGIDQLHGISSPSAVGSGDAESALVASVSPKQLRSPASPASPLAATTPAMLGRSVPSARHAPVDSIDASTRNSIPAGAQADPFGGETEGRDARAGDVKAGHHSDPDAESISSSVHLDIKHGKTSGDADSFTATQDGVLHLRWDNGNSWMTSKKMQLRVFNKHVCGKPRTESHTAAQA